MEVIIKNKAIEGILEEIGAEFRDLCPDDYRDFIEYVKLEGQNLVKPTGMSEEGALLNFMKIPAITRFRGRDGQVHSTKTNLYSFIKRQIRKRCGIEDFFHDSDNYRLLCKVWADAEVRRTPTHMLQVKGLE